MNLNNRIGRIEQTLNLGQSKVWFCKEGAMLEEYGQIPKSESKFYFTDGKNNWLPFDENMDEKNDTVIIYQKHIPRKTEN